MKRPAVGLCAVVAAICLSLAASTAGYPGPETGGLAPASGVEVRVAAPLEAYLALLNETGPVGNAGLAQGAGQDVAAILDAFISGRIVGGAASGAGAATGSGAGAVRNLVVSPALLGSLGGTATPVAMWSSSMDSILEAWKAARAAVGSAVSAAAPRNTTTAGNVNVKKDGFRVEIDGLDTENVTDVTWTREQVTVTVMVTDWNSWSSVMDRYIYAGDLGDLPDFFGQLELLDKDGKAVTGTVDLDGLKPVSVRHVRSGGDEKIGTFVVTFDREAPPPPPSTPATTTPASTTPSTPTTPASNSTNTTGTTTPATNSSTTTPSTTSSATPTPTPAATGIPVSGTVGIGNNFRVEVGNLPTDYVVGATWSNNGDLVLEISVRNLDEWREWVDDFIVGGGTPLDAMSTGALVFLRPDMKTETGSVEFYGLTPLSLSIGRASANDDALMTFKVTLSVDGVRYRDANGDEVKPVAAVPTGAAARALEDVALTVSNAVLSALTVFPAGSMVGGAAAGAASPLGLVPKTRPSTAGAAQITSEVSWANGDPLLPGPAGTIPPGATDAVGFTHAAARLFDACAQQAADVLCSLLLGTPAEQLLNAGDSFALLTGFSNTLQQDVVLRLSLRAAAQACAGTLGAVGCDAALNMFTNLSEWAADCALAPDSTACRSTIDPATALATELGPLFDNLAEGTTVIANGNTEVVRLPAQGDGLDRFALTRLDGSIDVLLRGNGNSVLVRAEVAEDEAGNTIYTLPSGTTITNPAPGIERVDVTEQPGLFATTVAEVESILDSLLNGDEDIPADAPSVAGIVVANGESMGDGVVTASFLNRGKPMVAQDPGLVLQALDDGKDLPAPVAGLGAGWGGRFQPVALWTAGPSLRPLVPVSRPGGALERAAAASLQQVEQIRALLARLPEDLVTTVSLTGYCLEKNIRPPAPGEIYLLAAGDKQQRFDDSRRIMAAAPRVRPLLDPDSDPGEYFHATVQWAIWTHEEGYDADSFVEAFVAYTRTNVAGANMEWTPEVETMVRQLSLHRFDDVQKVLREAEVAPAIAVLPSRNARRIPVATDSGE